MKKVPEAIKDLTPEQVETYTLLVNLNMKVIVTRCILVGFFILLAALLVLIFVPEIKSTWKEKTIVGAVDLIMGLTTTPLIKHYLPAVKTALRSKRKSTRASK